MSPFMYVYLGFAVTTATLAGYAVRVVLRGRKLSRTLPAGERTWR